MSEDEVLFTPSLSDACEGTKFIYCWGAETNPAEDYHLGDNSPCVDAGDPSDLYSDEPVPNGGRINLGAFGGTSEATTSLDLNGDGLPDVIENTICTDPNDADTDDDGTPDGVEDANHNGVVDSDVTDPCNSDTDGDDLPDGWEVDNELNPLDATGDNGGDGDPDNDAYSNLEEYYAGTNPNDVYSKPAKKANVNGDGDVDLTDATIALQVLAGIEPTSTVHKEADVNGDGKIGIEELIYILQKLSGLR